LEKLTGVKATKSLTSLQKIPPGKRILKRHIYHALPHADVSLPSRVFVMIIAIFNGSSFLCMDKSCFGSWDPDGGHVGGRWQHPW